MLRGAGGAEPAPAIHPWLAWPFGCCQQRALVIKTPERGRALDSLLVSSRRLVSLLHYYSYYYFYARLRRSLILPLDTSFLLSRAAGIFPFVGRVPSHTNRSSSSDLHRACVRVVPMKARARTSLTREEEARTSLTREEEQRERGGKKKSDSALQRLASALVILPPSPTLEQKPRSGRGPAQPFPTYIRGKTLSPAAQSSSSSDQHVDMARCCWQALSGTRSPRPAHATHARASLLSSRGGGRPPQLPAEQARLHARGEGGGGGAREQQREINQSVGRKGIRRRRRRPPPPRMCQRPTRSRDLPEKKQGEKRAKEEGRGGRRSRGAGRPPSLRLRARTTRSCSRLRSRARPLLFVTALLGVFPQFTPFSSAAADARAEAEERRRLCACSLARRRMLLLRGKTPSALRHLFLLFSVLRRPLMAAHTRKRQRPSLVVVGR